MHVGCNWILRAAPLSGRGGNRIHGLQELFWGRGAQVRSFSRNVTVHLRIRVIFDEFKASNAQMRLFDHRWVA